MAFLSERHKLKMAELVKQKKITQAEYDRHLYETGTKKLPERVKPKVEKK